MAVAAGDRQGCRLMIVVKSDFPVLLERVNGREVCYLDSAASAQKPVQVIEAMDRVMREHYANVHRGVYTFGTRTSYAYEDARIKVAKFLNAATEKEIVFTRNTTEAINLVAATWGEETIKAGDEIILSELEHHANIVPWVRLAERKGAVIRVIPITDDGALDMAAYQSLLSEKTRLVAVTHHSNALGTVTPINDIVRKARHAGAVTLVDGSQAVVHLDVNVRKVDCDFYVFTGHKLYGPSGVGILYGRSDILRHMPPYQGGGEMIETVAFDKVTFKEPPYRFEAGTPAIVETIGLGAAVDYFTQLDRHNLRIAEHALLTAAEDRLRGISGVKIWSNAPERAAILSFSIEGVHPHDAATIFDQLGVCVRAGHHCAQPLMKRLGVPATLRASFAIYNDIADVDRLAEAVETVKRLFKV